MDVLISKKFNEKMFGVNAWFVNWYSISEISF